jgi:UDP-glucose 4-epimerase
MRVLVTGATGNMGSSLLGRLRGRPEVSEVVGLARRPPRDAADDGAGADRWVAADLVTDVLAPVLEGIDTVVHLAWAIQPSRRPGVLWDTNVVGTRRLLAGAAQAGVRCVVHASSVGAYAPQARGDDATPPRRVAETWPTDGIATSSYSMAKAYVERCLDAFEEAQPSVRVVRLRPAITAKAGAATRVRRLFLGALVPAWLLRPGRLPIVPDIRGAGFQAVHTDDVADAFVRAVTRDVRGAFNLAADPWLSFRDIADLADARTVPVPGAAARPLVAASWHARLHPLEPGWVDLACTAPALDASRAREALDWSPRYGSREVVREALTAMAEGTGGGTPPLTPDSPSARVVELTARQGAEEIRP